MESKKIFFLLFFSIWIDFRRISLQQIFLYNMVFFFETWQRANFTKTDLTNFEVNGKIKNGIKFIKYVFFFRFYLRKLLYKYLLLLSLLSIVI